MRIRSPISRRKKKTSAREPLDDIRAEVKRSKSVLEFKPDWDGEGSSGYHRDTWERATDFLLRYARRLFSRHDIVIPVPQINPGPDGSIDLHWKSRRFELLLNFPPDPDEPAGFYGDDYGALKIKGKMKTDGFNQGLLLWLMEQR